MSAIRTGNAVLHHVFSIIILILIKMLNLHVLLSRITLFSILPQKGVIIPIRQGLILLSTITLTISLLEAAAASYNSLHPLALLHVMLKTEIVPFNLYFIMDVSLFLDLEFIHLLLE